MTEGAGVFILVGTPLGNREDLSPRARRTILEADLVLCEDTRSLPRLLGADESLPPRVSCFAANEESRIPLLLDKLGAGETVAYVSEAGLPIWSDPGRALLAAALEAGHVVDVIPGPTAGATALCHSGFRAAGSRFFGFLPRDGGMRTELVEQIARAHGPSIVFESGRRVPKLLDDLAHALPDAGSRNVAIARELTKLHQEVVRGSVAELSSTVNEALRGEVTVVIDGTAEKKDPTVSAVREAIEVMLADLPPRAKAKRLAALSGIASQELYRMLIDKR